MESGAGSGTPVNQAHLQHEERTAHSQETKNGERRAVPLVGTALQLVDALNINGGDSMDDFIFHSLENKTRRGCIRTAWEKAVKRAAITDFRFHDLRYSTASYLR